METIYGYVRVSAKDQNEARQLIAMQEEVEKTFIGEPVVQYVVQLIHATRRHSGILQGASPRATLMVVRMAKAWAQLQGRDYVIPQDVQSVFPMTVAHRLLLKAQTGNGNGAAMQILSDILARVTAPQI